MVGGASEFYFWFTKSLGYGTLLMAGHGFESGRVWGNWRWGKVSEKLTYRAVWGKGWPGGLQLSIQREKQHNELHPGVYSGRRWGKE